MEIKLEKTQEANCDKTVLLAEKKNA